MYTCALCDAPREADELQTIESVSEDPNREPDAPDTFQDTLTVCRVKCADVIRVHSMVILRDEPFAPEKNPS